MSPTITALLKRLRPVIADRVRHESGRPGDNLHHEMLDDLDRVIRDGEAEAAKGGTEARACTCHPDDNPPVPCAQKYALSECRAASPTPPAGADGGGSSDLAALSAGAAKGEWLLDVQTYYDEDGGPSEDHTEGVMVLDNDDQPDSIVQCSEANAKFIVALVNAFRAGELIPAPVPEVWRPVADWEDFYEVSDHGNVRSLPRRHTDKSGRAWIRGMAQINATISVNGYPMVSLSAPGRPRWTITVHRLVASAFIPNPDNLPFVNHKDSDRANNQVSNLEWCTHQENVAHAQAAGRLTGRPRGYVSGKRLFTDNEVRQAREMRRSGQSLREIAEHFGVGPTAIQSIISGKTYADVI